ncbi:MAG: hypothetical protein B7Z73_12970 [Planctomycetia bacterium 21-64-5]|nr:MAG: hypothetical protein B7Z73_12970 [Planctomycetia bacterium 21-64-5]HQU43970.1 hypothetical protein [Pirellulales bacterium]
MWIVAAAVLYALPHAVAQEGGPSTWLVGPELLRQRQQPVTITWDGVAVRDGLADLAKAERVAMLLDRRIDPGRPIDLSARREPLDELLVQISRKAEAEVTWLGPLAYVGPHAATARLRTLSALRAADVLALPKGKRTVFQRQAPMSWAMLAEPRKLVADLAAEAGVAIGPLELIDHDLWPAADLPPLSWTDRLTLLANEFDLTFEFVGDRQVRLTPVQSPVVIEGTYPRGKQAAEIAARWRTLAPQAQIEVDSGKIVVRGRVEDHELLVAKKPPPSSAPAAGVEVYTMKIEGQPLSAILDKLRRQLSIDIRADDAALEKAKLSLDRPVSFKVERASLDELLRAALHAADLDFVRKGDAYLVVPINPAGPAKSDR